MRLHLNCEVASQLEDLLQVARRLKRSEVKEEVGQNVTAS